VARLYDELRESIAVVELSMESDRTDNMWINVVQKSADESRTSKDTPDEDRARI
jgi:hypothetical protein